MSIAPETDNAQQGSDELTDWDVTVTLFHRRGGTHRRLVITTPAEPVDPRAEQP